MRASWVIVDEYANWRNPTLCIEDFEMKRLGRKDYAFFQVVHGNWGGRHTVERYKCSYPEAQRRFNTKLLIDRLTA